MPRFDRTGPEGEGPKTGRGFGKCEPNDGDSEKNQFGWRTPRQRMMRGGRRGRGRRFE